MTPKLLAVLLVAALLLSGCAAKKDKDGDGSSTSSSTSGTKSSSSSATSTGSAPNRAPVATLTAASLNGTVPFTGNFTLNATDADGDALSWTLDFGDGNQPANGTAAGGKLARSVSHAYGIGNHTVRLNVTDGKLTARANVTLHVVAGSGPVLPIVDQTLTVVFGCEACTDGGGDAMPCAGLAVDRNGVDCAWVTLDAAFAAGKTFTITGTSPSPAPSPVPSGANPDVAILDSCAADATVLLFQAADTSEVETGTVPAGAGCLVAWDYDETWVNIELHFLVQ